VSIIQGPADAHEEPQAFPAGYNNERINVYVEGF
jgi:hypothetical protein